MIKKSLYVCMLLVAACAFSGCKPRVFWTWPRDGATEVKGHAEIKACFNTRIDNSTLAMNLVCDNSPVDGEVEIITSSSGKYDKAVFTPQKYLPGGASCTLTIAAGLKSYETPLVMGRDFSCQFTVDSVPPELVSMPESRTVSESVLYPVILKFNEPIGTVDFSFTAHLVSYANNRKTVTVRALKLESGKTYSFKLSGYEDTAGNYFADNREIVLTVD